MLLQNDCSASDAEINIRMRSDPEVITNACRYRHLSFCGYFHGITLARMTSDVKPPTSALSRFGMAAERSGAAIPKSARRLCWRFTLRFSQTL